MSDLYDKFNQKLKSSMSSEQIPLDSLTYMPDYDRANGLDTDRQAPFYYQLPQTGIMSYGDNIFYDINKGAHQNFGIYEGSRQYGGKLYPAHKYTYNNSIGNDKENWYGAEIETYKNPRGHSSWHASIGRELGEGKLTFDYNRDNRGANQFTVNYNAPIESIRFKRPKPVMPAVPMPSFIPSLKPGMF